MSNSNSMKIMVDELVCIGTGNCEEICPKVFEVVDGKACVKVNPIPAEEVDCVREAVNACPARAISIT